MLTKRIIPCLDIKNGQTVKGINFVNLIHAGDPVELAQAYVLQGADELVFLDITATVENRKTLVKLVENVASAINIPFTVGVGILPPCVCTFQSSSFFVSIATTTHCDPNCFASLSIKPGF